MLQTVSSITPPGIVVLKNFLQPLLLRLIKLVMAIALILCIYLAPGSLYTLTNTLKLYVINSPDPAKTSIAYLPVRKPNTMPDTDGDGISDLDDIDDDSDGIPDQMEQYLPNPALANSNFGSGTFQDNIYWFNWTDSDFSDGLDDGDTQTFLLPNGTEVIATISNVVNLGNQGGDRYVADDLNTWSGARMHYLYDTPGSKEVFHSGGGNADDVSFDISFSASHGSLTQRLDYIVVDGESTNGKGEFINIQSDGGNWTVLEDYGSGAIYTGVGTQTLNITNTESSGVGNTVFYSENALSFSISINSDGGQAIGFGIYLESDTDNDGIFNHLDLDSDNDGIPDIVEAGGADVDGDGRVDNSWDWDGDGLANVFETANGSTSSLFDPDGDGINEDSGDFDGDNVVNWLDLDSDNDGLADVTEAGGTDLDFNSLIDGEDIDTDEDGFADGVDGDVGDNGHSENLLNVLVLTTMDITSNGKPDLGYLLANTDLIGMPDFVDIDADNDGIVDNTEAQKTDSYIAPTGLDTDGDGLDNAYDGDETAFGGLALLPEDTDGAGWPDYRDLDSDEDLYLDILEGHDFDGDFIADLGSPANLGVPTGLDLDIDGLDDGFDNDNSIPDPTNSNLQPSSHPNNHESSESDWRSLQTLSIENSNFQAHWQGLDIILNWKSPQSTQPKHFQVLRKISTQKLYNIIGIVEATADSLYQFTDSLLLTPSPNNSIFYQFKQISHNGSIAYSPVIELTYEKQELIIEAFPNPGSKKVTLKYAKANPGKHQINMLNINGENVFHRRLSYADDARTDLEIGHLPKGVYFLQIKNDWEQKTIKLTLN